MKFWQNTQLQQGFTFVELIIVSAISVIIFGALFVGFQSALELIATTRTQLSAASLATERMEFFRSLPYDQVGTLTGIISGPVANNQTLVFNGMEFTERIVIDYVDGVGDGLGASDSNAITNDYKRLKLSYTWEINGTPRELSLTSDIVPRGIETDVGGGSIRINVLDSMFQPLPGATVEISNSGTSLFESRVSNLSGEVLLSGVPADSDYELLVTGPIGGVDYSTDSTYPVTSENVSPSLIPFAVTEGGVSTLTFTIDELSDLTFRTYSDLQTGSTTESFSDATGVASTTETTEVTSGSLQLSATAAVYTTAGIAFLSPIVPATIERWESIASNIEIPPSTTLRIRLYTFDVVSGYVPIPDSDLPGNAIGFSDTIIDLQPLDPISYPEIIVGVEFETSDTSVSPSVSDLSVYWRADATPRTGLPLNIRGDKQIGTRADASVIYKTTDTVTTDSSGEVDLPDWEFDMYYIDTVTPFDIAMACPSYPLQLLAGQDTETELVLVADATTTLRAVVQDGLSRALPGASVQLERGAYDETRITDSCGQAFFTGGLTDASDYEVTVSAPGYSAQNITSVSIIDDAVEVITLTP